MTWKGKFFLFFLMLFTQKFNNFPLKIIFPHNSQTLKNFFCACIYFFLEKKIIFKEGGGVNNSILQIRNFACPSDVNFISSLQKPKTGMSDSLRYPVNLYLCLFWRNCRYFSFKSAVKSVSHSQRENTNHQRNLGIWIIYQTKVKRLPLWTEHTPL